LAPLENLAAFTHQTILYTVKCVFFLKRATVIPTISNRVHLAAWASAESTVGAWEVVACEYIFSFSYETGAVFRWGFAFLGFVRPTSREIPGLFVGITCVV
jgi:hypothetical protein